jgi:hypothetical protein
MSVVLLDIADIEFYDYLIDRAQTRYLLWTSRHWSPGCAHV